MCRSLHSSYCLIVDFITNWYESHLIGFVKIGQLLKNLRMFSANVKIDKFIGRNNFGLWKIKMWSLLKQQELWLLLISKLKKVVADDEEWHTLKGKGAFNDPIAFGWDAIIKVTNEETVVGLWLKLESLYMTKSLTQEEHCLSITSMSFTQAERYISLRSSWLVE